ncbi:MAG TPA: polysaccharide pyruvyl transferase family protein [Candidatus Saccharimonadales bacterium]|nr:polysaccharide pyruvyl transferase family protein [Candidatus Saccharimonadales bacterium]
MAKQNNQLLLLGAYGRGNVGDDVFILSATALFKGRTLYINSADDSLLPEQARGTVRTISTVSPRDVLAKIKLFLALKQVVYWGGDLWVELYGTKAPRQLLYKMVAMNLLLRLFGKRIYYIGCGIGDLYGASRFLARLSARLARKVVVREQRSAGVLDLPQVAVLPDLAINLPYNRARRHALPAKRPFAIVISVLWSIPHPEQNFPKVLQAIAGLINSLPAKDFAITLLPMHSTGEDHDDVWASQQLLSQIQGHEVTVYANRDLETIVTLLREADLVIGTRLHADILAVLNGTPAIGISYRPKVRSFFADNGLDAYCLDLDDVARLRDVFYRVYDDYKTAADVFYAASKQNLEQRGAYEALVRGL